MVLSGWLFFLSFAFTFGGRRKATNKSQPKDKNHDDQRLRLAHVGGKWVFVLPAVDLFLVSILCFLLKKKKENDGKRETKVWRGKRTKTRIFLMWASLRRINPAGQNIGWKKREKKNHMALALFFFSPFFFLILCGPAIIFPPPGGRPIFIFILTCLRQWWKIKVGRKRLWAALKGMLDFY